MARPLSPRRLGRASLALPLLLALAAAAPPAARAQEEAPAFAVIVNADNDVDSLRFDDLRAIFRLERQFWPNGHRISLVLPPLETPEGEVLLRRLYGMNAAQLRRYWVTKLFRGEIPAVPLVLKQSSAIVPAVQHSSEAISIVLVRGPLKGVRMLSIDGVPPGQPGYALPATDGAGAKGR